MPNHKADIIKRLCLKQNISFKWPNDVFVNGRKICGILQELITLNEKNFLIVGMGVNIVSNPNIEVGYEATNIFFEIFIFFVILSNRRIFQQFLKQTKAMLISYYLL